MVMDGYDQLPFSGELEMVVIRRSIRIGRSGLAGSKPSEFENIGLSDGQEDNLFWQVTAENG